MSGYKTYRFRDKDPIIDELRTILQAMARVEGVKEAVLRNRIADSIRMSRHTPWAWFHGSTRFPRHAGVKAFARGMGRDLRLGR